MAILKSFSKIIFAITLFLLPLFVLIFILRLNNGRDAYFGYEEIFKWIEQQDFKKPYQDFIDFLRPYVDRNVNTYIQFASNLTSFTSGNFFVDIFNILKGLFQVFGATFQLLAVPFIILYFFIVAIVQYISMFVNFITYVVSA